MSNSPHDAFDELDVEGRREINSLVERLERHYKSNCGQTSIEQLLEAAPGHLRDHLLYELLVEEKSRLAALGVTPNKNKLLRRFPDHPTVVAAIVADAADSELSIDVDLLLNEPGQIAGYRFGKFELMSLLGKGTFGAVFEALDTTIDRRVALKVPRNKLMIEILGAGQLLDEAKNSAILYHQNIVPVFEAGGYQDGGFYVASQLIDGNSLREEMKTKLELKRSAKLLRDLTSGVAHAHEHGVIHNDIKPENVMIDGLGNPMLTDFGLSELKDSQFKTASGGSLPYVAPERIEQRGHGADSRSDIWSLGVLLFELIFGNRPFNGSEKELQNQIYDQEHLAKLTLDWPDADIESVCKKCLTLERESRYQSARQLENDLARYLNGHPVSTRRPPLHEQFAKWTQRRPLVAGLASLVLLSLLTIGIGSAFYANWMSQRATELSDANTEILDSLQRERKAKQDILRRNYAGGMYEALDNYHDQEYYACLDKLNNLATIESENELRRFEWYALRNMALQSAQHFPVQTAPIADADLSPDGKKIATVARDGIAIIQDAANGSLLWRIETGRYPVEGVVFTNDSEKLLTASHRAVQEWSLETGECLRSRAFPGSAFVNLSLSPDNKTFAVSKANTVFVCDYSSFDTKFQFEQNAAIRRLTFSPNGKLLVSCGVDAMTRVWASDTGELIQELRGHSKTVHDAVFSPNGKRLVTAGWDSKVCIWDTENWKLLDDIKAFEGILRCVQFSPDGKLIAAAGKDKSAKVWDSSTLELLNEFNLHEYMIEHLEFSQESEKLFTIEFGGVAHIGDTLQSNTPRVRCWDLKADNKQLLPQLSLGSRHGDVFDLGPAWPYAIIELDGTSKFAVLSHLGKQTEKPFSQLQLIDLSDNTTIANRVFPNTQFFNVKRSPNGKVFVVVSAHKILVLDHQLNEIALKVQPQSDQTFSDLEFLSDSSIAVLSSGPTSKFEDWDWKTDNTTLLKQENATIKGLSVSPSKTTIAFSYDDRVVVWDPANDSSVELKSPVPCGQVEFANNENLILANTTTHGVIVWDLAGGDVMKLDSHQEPVRSTVFSADSTRIVTTSDDGHVKIWDSANGSEIFDLGGFPGHLKSSCFTKDGKRLILGSCDWPGHRKGELFTLSY